MHHRLEIDTDSLSEHVVRITEYRKSGEQRECNHIRNASVTELLILGKCDKRQYIKRRRSELEREDVPSVIPDKSSILHRKAVNQLLVDFKHQNNSPHAGCETSENFIRAILVFSANEYRDHYYQCNADKMINAERFRCLSCFR